MLFIRIRRKKESHKYKRDFNKKDDWFNNDANNCLDEFILYDYETVIFTAKCQTVANLPGGIYKDTVAEGPFLMRCFVEKRNFHCEVHGICQTSTLGFEWIGNDSTTIDDKERWLFHDDQKLKPSPAGVLTRVCWSEGCFVLHKSDLDSLNEILIAYKKTSGQTIDGEVVEV
jgi:hypothetical protein